jgi:hypothetical protein
MLPNYFFSCPQCRKQIVVFFDWKNKSDDVVLEGLCCLKVGEPKGCGWTGDLHVSEGHPLPVLPA